MSQMEKYIRFIQETEQLKSVLRTAWTAEGRHESTAEHTWRLALLAGLFLDDYPNMDIKKVLLMCLIHDIGEIYEGDISAAELPDQKEKYDMEKRAVKKVFSLLPEKLETEFMEIWEEYSENSSKEAHLVKALDKAETIIQHNQGSNPAGFDYQFNLGYGAEYFREDPLLEELREKIDEETARKALEMRKASGMGKASETRKALETRKASETGCGGDSDGMIKPDEIV